jgi:hypothetical protein
MGCIEDSNGGEYNVSFNVLYSSPYHINNTTIYLDDELLLQFQNTTIETYPPFLGEKTTRLNKGDHELTVVDTNFGISKTSSITVNGRMYCDIIISEDEIDISVSAEPTGFKTQ